MTKLWLSHHVQDHHFRYNLSTPNVSDKYSRLQLSENIITMVKETQNTCISLSYNHVLVVSYECDHPIQYY